MWPAGTISHSRLLRVASFWNTPALRKLGRRLSALAQGAAEQAARPGGRAAPRSVPTARRARRIEYRPELDGAADPGEIVWTWVPYEDDATQGKDRPVLVVGRERGRLLGLMLSSQAKHGQDPEWLSIGTGAWDRENRPSWIRLDRVLEVSERGIRREGAVLDQDRFDRVAAQLRSRFGWS
jgi:hypothetical protein